MKNTKQQHSTDVIYLPENVHVKLPPTELFWSLSRQSTLHPLLLLLAPLFTCTLNDTVRCPRQLQVVEDGTFKKRIPGRTGSQCKNLVSCCCRDVSSRVFVRTWKTLDDKDGDQTQEFWGFFTLMWLFTFRP